MTVRPICGEDIFLWPDGTWYYREEVEESFMSMSDDYEVIPFDTPRWNEVIGG